MVLESVALVYNNHYVGEATLPILPPNLAGPVALIIKLTPQAIQDLDNARNKQKKG